MNRICYVGRNVWVGAQAMCDDRPRPFSAVLHIVSSVTAHAFSFAGRPRLSGAAKSFLPIPRISHARWSLPSS